MELPVTFRLSSIYCKDEGDGIGDAEPYLWTIYFKIDGQTIHQNGLKLDSDAVFFFGPGSHGNLGVNGVSGGSTVNIPALIGEWSSKLSPITIMDFNNNPHNIPGIAGVAAVLMEEDNVTDGGAESGHQALNNFLQTSINDFIHNISLLDFAGTDHPKDVLDAKIEDLKTQIKNQAEGVVHDAIVNKQPWYSNLWSWVNADDKIGSQIWMFDQDQVVAARYSIDFSEHWINEGDWEIFGNISAPNPCQGPLVAVNQQNVVIHDLQNQLHSLQSELARANPELRAEIRDEIKDVNLQISNAKKALVPLQNALNRCYLLQSIVVGHLGNVGGVVVGKVN
jgi:hypothetical protein